MSRLVLTLLAVTLLLAGCREAEQQFTVIGYHSWWMGDAWSEVDLTAIDELLFFDLSVGPDGTITETNGWPEAWRPMIDAAHLAGTRVKPSLTLFDAEYFTAIFESPSAQDTLLAQTIRLVEYAGADGVHIDFELFDDVSADARANFPRWIRALKRALGPESSVSVYTLAIDDFNRYDERRIARAADYLVVQGYDFHWTGGPFAGPNAALSGWGRLNWKAVLARYDSLRVPRSSILMATPYFGYEWPTEHGEIGSPTRGEGRIIAYAPIAERVPELGAAALDLAREHGMRRDPESGSPFYAFESDSGWLQGWFDDAESLRTKYDFVHRMRLGGVAVFPLGYDGGRLTGLLHEAFPDSVRAHRPVVRAADREEEASEDDLATEGAKARP